MRLTPLLALGLFAAGCHQAPATNLLSNKVPAVTGVQRAATLNDAIAVPDGDTWSSVRTAQFDCKHGKAVFDLGESKHIKAGWLQGDNNDIYEVSVSQDGQNFLPLWSAPQVGGTGMQPRSSDTLDGTGRYVQVRAGQGDNSCALSEVMLWEEKPSSFPPDLPRRLGFKTGEQTRTALLLFGLALCAFVLLSFQRGPKWLLASAALPVWTGLNLWNAIQDSWPPEMREVAMGRGLVGMTALLIVVWEVMAPRGIAPRRGAVIGSLIICGAAGVACFYNFVHGQFWDAEHNESTFVHQLDLRQYYTTAKFFPEINYWRMYQADIAAYSEDTGRSLDSLATTPVRDLFTNRPSTVAGQRAEIQAIKARFSPARWEAYKADIRYQRLKMSDGGWFNTINDLGANATPVWITMGYVLFNVMPTSDSWLRVLALIDPILILLMFIAIGWAFGPRTMAVVMVVFGANDFVMYGSNWAGAVLRHDWLVYLGLYAAFLRQRKWVWAGVFVALSTSIRAFPAFTAISLTFPALWWLAEKIRADRRMPKWKEILEAQRPLITVAVAATATLVGLVVVTSAILGPSSWLEWSHKVSLINSEIHINPVCLKTVVAGNDESRWRLLDARMPLYVTLTIGIIAMVLVAARAKRLEQAAMLGLIFLPVLMMPANYYEHVVCLYPLIATDRAAAVYRRLGGDQVGPNEPPLDLTDLVIWGSILAVCAVQYLTTMVEPMPLHFWFASVLLLTSIAVYLFAMVRRDGPAMIAAWTAPRAVPAPLLTGEGRERESAPG
ncbi:MAG: hypothetical protein QM723_28825 [Myxococcaceae bacterium]